MENLYKDLEQLFQTGSFRLFPDQCGSLKMELQYQYRSSSVKQRAVSEQPGGSPTSSIPFAEAVRFRETWNIDQINDFVHQLSFFDANKEEETMVHHFQHVNEVSLANGMCVCVSQLFFPDNQAGYTRERPTKSTDI